MHAIRIVTKSKNCSTPSFHVVTWGQELPQVEMKLFPQNETFFPPCFTVVSELDIVAPEKDAVIRKNIGNF